MLVNRRSNKKYGVEQYQMSFSNGLGELGLGEMGGHHSTTRTPATDILYNTTNGRAHNSTINLPHRNARAQHLDMSKCWDVANFCPLVMTLLYNKL